MAGGKKAEQKRKEKMVEDKTFGLKNKNRSAKVQAYVQQVQTNVNSRNPADRKSAAELEARRRAKEEKRAREAEMALLFKSVDQQLQRGGAAGHGGGGEHGEGGEGGEGEDAYANLAKPDEYLFRPEDFDEIERDERRLEEQLEAEREALAGRTDLTPVTEASFQAWKARKRAEATEREAARVRRAKAGEGKLRGRDLWEMDQELFVDDDDADEFYEREELDEVNYDLS